MPVKFGTCLIFVMIISLVCCSALVSLLAEKPEEKMQVVVNLYTSKCVLFFFEFFSSGRKTKAAR